MCENVDNLITQEEIKPRFWTQLPNLLFEMSLSANAIALYAAIKRSAGSSDGRQCTRSTRTLARNTGMSASSVVRAKRELEGLGLIRIKEVAKGRGECQSYTTSERDALWARYKDPYLALVDQGLDPNRHCSDIAKALGLTREEGHILHAGYSAWVSMQESPVDLSFLERV